MKAILLTAAIAVGISSFATSAAFAVPVDASFTRDKVNFTPIEKAWTCKVHKWCEHGRCWVHKHCWD
jgi:hypothetical protein